MRLINNFLFLIALILMSCATKPPEKVLTFSEQIQVDTEKAQSLYQEFQKKVTFESNPKLEKYLTGVALKLAKQDPNYQIQLITVKIHQDTSPNLARFFSFPGTTLSIPFSFLKKVKFENELAAAIAFELSNIMKRTLATRVEQMAPEKPVLFGVTSIFDLDQDERKESIWLGVKLLYFAGYDTRGMSSIFQRYPPYYAHSGASDLNKKEVNLNVREAQRAKSEFLPSLKPVVRSDEFIQFKKELN